MSCYVTQAPTAIKLVVAMEPPDARGGRVLLTVILTFFVSSTGFSMMLPSLSFFLRELAPSFTESRMHLWLGLCVSANAIGQGLASPLAGMWMRHSGHFAPLIASLIISQIGSVMFLLARPLSHNLANLFAASPEICGVVLVMVARLLIGISDSNLTVCRVLLLQLSPLPASNDEENDASGERMERCKATRTKYLSYESAARSLGLIMGAVLSSAFAPFEFTIGGLLINAKNSPGLAALSLCSINLCLIVIYLRPSAYLPESPSSTPLLSNQVAADNGINSAAQNPVPDRTAVIACLLVYFANVSIFSLFETITTPFLSDQLGWSVSNVALYFIGCSALMLMLFLFAVPKVQQIFGIRPTLAIGLSAAAMGLLITPPYSDYGYPSGPTHSRIILIQYASGSFFFLCGYSMSTVMNIQIYSSLLSARWQPLYTSFTILVGCSARVIGPLWATALYTLDHSARYVYISCAIVCLLALLCAASIWSRLVPVVVDRPRASSEMESDMPFERHTASIHDDQFSLKNSISDNERR